MFAQEADEIGLSSEERKMYIKERMKEERELEQEKLKMQIEMEKEERQLDREREKELEQEKLQMQMERDRMVHELEMAKLSSSSSNFSITAQPVSKLPQLPPFVDGKDDLDSWLLRFERFAEANQWPKASWSTYLSALVSGRALDCFCRLSTLDAQDYDTVKEALQMRYNLTEDGFREKFRQCAPEDGENAAMFVTRLKTYLERWIDLAKIDKEYSELRDLFVKEQFMDACPKDLATHLREKRSKTLDNVAEEAESFLVARRRQLSANKQFQRPSKHEAEKSEVNTITSPMLCWKCNSPSHKARDCKENGRGGNYHTRKPSYKSESYKKAGAAVVAQPDKSKTADESAEGVTENINVEAEVKDGKLQVSLPVTSCGSCSEDGRVMQQNLPVMKGLIGEQEVDVLRDTGCEGVIVKRKFVKDEQLTGRKKLIIKIDNTVVLVDEACIDVKTPFFSGIVNALCLPEAICDLIIGNVDGARSPDNPDTEVMVGAATTRNQKNQGKKTTSLRVPELKGYRDIDKLQLVKMQAEDPTVTKLESVTRDGNNRSAWFERRRGVLYRFYEDKRRRTTEKQVVLPSELRNYVMSVAHDSIVGGHLGIGKTKSKVTSSFYWPGVDGDVTRYCKSCDVCQKTVNRGAVSRAPMQNIPVVDTPFKRVAMDLVGPIEPPSEAGHRYILTLVDYATRYPEAVPLKKIDTETVAEALVDIYSRI